MTAAEKLIAIVEGAKPRDPADVEKRFPRSCYLLAATACMAEWQAARDLLGRLLKDECLFCGWAPSECDRAEKTARPI